MLFSYLQLIKQSGHSQSASLLAHERSRFVFKLALLFSAQDMPDLVKNGSGLLPDPDFLSPAFFFIQNVINDQIGKTTQLNLLHMDIANLNQIECLYKTHNPAQFLCTFRYLLIYSKMNISSIYCCISYSNLIK